MKKFLVAIVVILTLLIVAAGLIYVLVPKETLIAKVKPEIGNFRIEGTSIGLQYTTITVKADVTSKAVPVFVDSLSYAIFMADEQVTQGRQTFLPESKQGQIQTLHIPVKLSHNDARKLMQLKMSTGAPLVARIQAYSNLPFVGPKRFDFQKELDVPLPAIPGLDFL